MSSDATTPVILSARRTPIGRFLGGLSRVPAPDLGQYAIEAALGDAGVAADAIEEVFMGCVLQAGVGQNPARQAALKAGIPDTVTAVTVNKVCGSGLEAVMQAARAIKAGDIDAAVASTIGPGCEPRPPMIRTRGWDRSRGRPSISGIADPTPCPGRSSSVLSSNRSSIRARTIVRSPRCQRRTAPPAAGSTEAFSERRSSDTWRSPWD